MIDLRSDTATRPTEGMRAAIAAGRRRGRAAAGGPDGQRAAGAGGPAARAGGGTLPADGHARQPDRAEAPFASRGRARGRAARARRDLRVRRARCARRPDDRGDRRDATAASVSRSWRPPSSRARSRPTSGRPCSRSRTRTTRRVGAAGRSRRSRRSRRRPASAAFVRIWTARGCSTPPWRPAFRRRRRAALRHRHALSVQGSRLSARSAPRRIGGHDRARVAREAPVRRRHAAGGDRRGGRRLRPRPPRRAPRGRPHARAAAR